MKKLPILLLTFLYPLWILAQIPADGFTSIAHEQSVFYNSLGLHTEAQFDSLNHVLYGNVPPHFEPHGSSNNNREVCTLNREVYGFHPYWIGASTYNNYDYHLISTLAYFSYELNPNTGSYTDLHAWKTTNAINLARAAGCKIDLTVTNFGSANNTAFLTNQTAWDTFADSLIAVLNVRQANGVNIDFEGASSSQDDNFTAFITYLDNRLATDRPNTTISIDLYAVDWGGFFNIADLVPHVDRFIIMGYDYHYSGDAQAGPCAPLYTGSIWGNITLTKSVNTYLTAGIPPSKLIMAIPYYGYDWTTESASIPSNTTATGSSRTYRYLRDNFYGIYTRQWDSHSSTPYFVYLSGGNTRQCWFDDEVSLAQRYDLVLNKQLAGTGIWALGYDDGYNQLWDLLEAKFTDCHEPCTGNTAYDTGGSLGNYQNNENYTLTFSSQYAAVPVSVVFDSFDIENGFDKLRIYDGNSITAPLIGEYTGTNSPGTVTSTGSALTIKFTSDNATVRPGFALHWQCGSCYPTATILPLQDYYNNDFTVTFTDNDACGNGLNGKFYQVLAEVAPNDWRANGKAAFFNDEFDSGILSADWGAATGTWIADEGVIYQINTAEDNTNLYAEVTQNNTGTYLYQFRMNILGEGTNRRAGLHFFASDGAAENRGNSYFVFLRADGDKAQIYKVANNTFNLVSDNSLVTNTNQWYDYKVTYTPTTGEIRLYRDNVQVATWTDASPITTGSFVSLRTGNCEAQYDFVRMFRTRGNTASVSVGTAPTDNIIYNTTAPLNARIVSVVRDNNNHWTNLAVANTIIDIWLSVEPNIAPNPPITLYPNPTNSQLNLQLHTDTYTLADVTIVDLMGKTVSAQNQLSLTQGSNQLTFEVANLTAGQYILVVKTPQNTFQRSFVVVK
ncbi:MAG: T9SS type A sorting domain-containing protein [Sphingobacteriales bacterium]|nr:T9SS type A sorting domain-containing protein [Sphingobacteriales bacterium]